MWYIVSKHFLSSAFVLNFRSKDICCKLLHCRLNNKDKIVFHILLTVCYSLINKTTSQFLHVCECYYYIIL